MKENIHTLRNELTEAHQKKIEEIINANQSKSKYYIFVISTPHSTLEGVIKTTFTLLSQIPPRMLGSMLYFVDNGAGKLERLWVIPRDIIRPEKTVDYENFDDNIQKIGKQQLILN